MRRVEILGNQKEHNMWIWISVITLLLSIIITLDNSSVIYCDLKIPENFASVIKNDLPIEAKFSGYKRRDPCITLILFSPFNFIYIILV